MKSGPFHVSDVDHRELLANKTGEKYTLSAILSELIGFKDMFVYHEIIFPGRRSSAPHAHSSREEMVFVLEGAPIAYFKGQDYLLKPGDFIGFQPGPENFRFLKNDTTVSVKVLVIASNPKHDEVICS